MLVPHSPMAFRISPQPRRHVLLVEPDADLASGFVDVLRASGSIVIRAATEERAELILENFAVDVAVVDLDGLPSGVRFLRRLEELADRGRHAVTTIALARAASVASIVDDPRIGPVGILAKPIQIETLVAAVGAIAPARGFVDCPS
jgi:DNA-binding response OmpR family regulator